MTYQLSTKKIVVISIQYGDKIIEVKIVKNGELLNYGQVKITILTMNKINHYV